jgi:hypothetical protein
VRCNGNGLVKNSSDLKDLTRLISRITNEYRQRQRTLTSSSDSEGVRGRLVLLLLTPLTFLTSLRPRFLDEGLLMINRCQSSKHADKQVEKTVEDTKKVQDGRTLENKKEL